MEYTTAYLNVQSDFLGDANREQGIMATSLTIKWNTTAYLGVQSDALGDVNIERGVVATSL